MPPAAAAAGAGAALGFLPGAIAGVTGAGKSKARAGNFVESNAYDANRYEYGGRPGVADETAGRYAARGQAYDAAAHGYMGEGHQDRGLSLEARGRQAEAQNLMINRARGRNLVSTQVANRARNDLGASMRSAAASAQGPAALANAQSDSMAAQAQGLGVINQQEQIASQQEQMAAEQAAFGAASGMREGDIGQRGQSLGAAGQMAGASAQFGALENNVRSTQMQGNLEQQKLAAGSHTEKDRLNTQVDVNNANKDLEYIKMAAGGAQGGAQTGISAGQPPPPGAGGGGGGGSGGTSDPLAKTGIMDLGGPGGYESVDASTPMGSDGSLNVQGAMEKFSTVPTNMSGVSDPKAKTDVLPLYEPPGKQLHQSAEGRAFFADESESDGRPSLSGPTPRYSKHAPVERAPRAAKSRPRSMTVDELRRAADELEASMRSEHETRMAAGPSVSDPKVKEWKPIDPLAGTPKKEAPKLTPEEEAEDARRVAEFMKDGNPDISYSNKPEDKRRAAEEDKRWLENERAARADDARKAEREDKAEFERLLREREAARRSAMEGETFKLHGGLDTGIPTGKMALWLEDHVLPKPDASPEAELGRIKRRKQNDERIRAARQWGDRQSQTGVMKRIMDTDFMQKLAALEHPRKMQTFERDPRPEAPEHTASVSDPRAKELGGVHDNEVAHTLDVTPAVSYRYKDESYEPDAQRPGERQVGFLTSDLKKSPLGATVVEKRPDGLEGYNRHRLDGLQHAEIRNLHERLRELEAMMAGGRHGR